jgi:hypothetical protein
MKALQVSNHYWTHVPERSNEMAFSMAGGGPSSPEINVTPLIDVLLVLIIVFMVVVSMSKDKMLKAQIPQPAPGSARQAEVERTIVVQIGAARDPEQAPELKIKSAGCKLGQSFRPVATRICYKVGEGCLRTR